MKKTFFLLSILYSSFLILHSTPVSAIGVSVTPSEESMSAVAGKETIARIEIENPSNEVALFEVYPDEFGSFIKPMPAKFTLESGEKREVKLKVTPPKSGEYRTNISVVARSLSDSSFGVGSGVKMSLTIKAKERDLGLGLISMGENTWLFAPIVLLLVSIVFYYRRRLRRSAAGKPAIE